MKSVRIFTSEQPAHDLGLKLIIRFEGVVNLAFVIRLIDADGNTIIDNVSGNNLEASQFQYDFPSPSMDNNGRTLQVRCRFRGLDPGNFPKFRISSWLYQNHLLLNEDIREGDLTGGYQSVSMTYKINV